MKISPVTKSIAAFPDGSIYFEADTSFSSFNSTFTSDFKTFHAVTFYRGEFPHVTASGINRGKYWIFDDSTDNGGVWTSDNGYSYHHTLINDIYHRGNTDQSLLMNLGHGYFLTNGQDDDTLVVVDACTNTVIYRLEYPKYNISYAHYYDETKTIAIRHGGTLLVIDIANNTEFVMSGVCVGLSSASMYTIDADHNLSQIVGMIPVFITNLTDTLGDFTDSSVDYEIVEASGNIYIQAYSYDLHTTKLVMVDAHKNTCILSDALDINEFPEFYSGHDGAVLLIDNNTIRKSACGYVFENIYTNQDPLEKINVIFSLSNGTSKFFRDSTGFYKVDAEVVALNPHPTIPIMSMAYDGQYVYAFLGFNAGTYRTKDGENWEVLIEPVYMAVATLPNGDTVRVLSGHEKNILVEILPAGNSVWEYIHVPIHKKRSGYSQAIDYLTYIDGHLYMGEKGDSCFYVSKCGREWFARVIPRAASSLPTLVFSDGLLVALNATYKPVLQSRDHGETWNGLKLSRRVKSSSTAYFYLNKHHDENSGFDYYELSGRGSESIYSLTGVHWSISLEDELIYNITKTEG